jgi:hypothetical protein
MKAKMRDCLSLPKKLQIPRGGQMKRTEGLPDLETSWSKSKSLHDGSSMLSETLVTNALHSTNEHLKRAGSPNTLPNRNILTLQPIKNLLLTRNS